MFARVFALLPLALLVSATTFKSRGDSWDGGNDCSSGTVQCCNQWGDASDAQSWAEPSLLSVIAGLTGLVGTDCTPVSVLALGGNSCTSQTACCDNTEMNGLVAVGCNNINL